MNLGKPVDCKMLQGELSNSPYGVSCSLPYSLWQKIREIMSDELRDSTHKSISESLFFIINEIR